MFDDQRNPRILDFQKLPLVIQNAFRILHLKRKQFLKILEVRGLHIAATECFDFDPSINWSELSPEDEKFFRERYLDEGFDHETWIEFIKWCEATDKFIFKKAGKQQRMELLVWYLAQENPISTEINTQHIEGEIFALPRENSPA